MAVFTFYSRDQGWSDYPEHHGTTINSYSWFEAGLTPNIVPIKSLEQRERRVEKEHKRYELQRNLHAEKKVQKHIKTIDQGHELLSCVEEGDRITVWACAAFPEWVNRVSGASIELLFLDDLNETMEAKMELEEDW